MRSFSFSYKIGGFLLFLLTFFCSAERVRAVPIACSISSSTVIDQTYVTDNECSSINIEGNVSTTWIGTVDLIGSGTVTVKSGYTMTMGTLSGMVLGSTDDFVVEERATTTHSVGSPTGVNVTARNITISGSIDASARGCLGNNLGPTGGQGPDLSTGVCATANAGYGVNDRGGASHAGTGGGSVYGVAGQTVQYGSSTYPILLGSGGGGVNGAASGGNGGGRVHLIANGSLLNSGLVSVDGGTGTNGAAGGGSGGSIYVRAATYGGGGSFTANGGGSGSDSGAGGGGRVAVFYSVLSGSMPTVVAAGGVRDGGSAGGAGSGQAGTTYILDRIVDDGLGNLRITSGLVFFSGGDFTRSTITIDSGALLRCETQSSLTVSAQTVYRDEGSTWSCQYPIDTVNVSAGTFLYTTGTTWTFSYTTSVTISASTWYPGNVSSSLTLSQFGASSTWDIQNDLTLTKFVYTGPTHAGTQSSQGGFLTILNPVNVSLVGSLIYANLFSADIASLSIDADSLIDATGRGCAANTLNGGGYGPNVSTGICTHLTSGYGKTDRGGAAHAGTGSGSIYGGAGQSDTYGSSTYPVLFGSGGAGIGSNGLGGRGGGRVFLVMSGSLTNNGRIMVDGQTGVSAARGGGSGGSIYLRVGALAGGGIITARGGGAGTDAGGGGGGRIAIYYSALDGFSLSDTYVTTTGGLRSGSSSGKGTEGSVYTLQVNTAPDAPSSLGPTALVNGSTTGTNTPTVSFTLSDPDVSNTVKYRIQIDDSSDFSSAVVDYTSALAAQGARTFQVGQAAGSGSYTVGSVSQTLSDGSYYWRVKTIDSNAAESSYATANSGAIAFVVNGTVPSVQFAQATASALENVTATSVHILLSAAHFETVTVNYALTGTATGGGTDYTLVDGTATIPIGNTTATIPITIVNDEIFEGSETIILTLSSPSNATLGSNGSLTYTILDNDTAGVTLSESTLSVIEGGATDTYTIVLTSQPTSTVQIAIAPSAASIGVSTTTVSFTSSNWSTPQTITVTATDDATVDGTETPTIAHTIASSTATGYPSSTSLGTITVTVTDNDSAPADNNTSNNRADSGGGAATAGSSAGTGLGVAVTWTFVPREPVPPVSSSVSPDASSPVPPLVVPPLVSPITTILNVTDPARVAELLNNGRRDLTREAQALTRVEQDLRVLRLLSTPQVRTAQSIFLAYGASDVTARLGIGERQALLRDAFETMRTAQVPVTDLERMARGIPPETRNLAQERAQLPRVRQTFRTIYGREPDFRNPEENLAWNTLMYRIRFPRNLSDERQGIVEFRRLFGRDPRDPFQWATVRVLGYVR